MSGLLRFFSRTWLATTLFLTTSTAIWWTWLSWGSARVAILPSLVVVPIGWWWLVGRRTEPKVVRGVWAGAVIGVASQVLPQVLPMIWESVTYPGHRDGGGDLVVIAVAYIYLLVGLGASVVGGALGLIVALVQKASDRRAVAGPGSP